MPWTRRRRGLTTSDIENKGLTTSDIENKESINTKLEDLYKKVDSDPNNKEFAEDFRFRTDQLDYFDKLKIARIQHDKKYIPILENLTNPEIDRRQYQDFLRNIPGTYKDFFFDN